jgi:protein tyrosine/serine phosphatase
MKLLVLISVLAFTGFAADVPSGLVHVRNLGVVNDHLLRGAEPNREALDELGSAGVKVIIDLREPGPRTEREKQEAKRLGIAYTNVPFPPVSAPSPRQINTVLTMLAQNNSQTVFVHCRRGKDRTGTVLACYRVQHDGWDNRKALEEARSYGMSGMQHGMKAFILRFTPLPAVPDPALLTH